MYPINVTASLNNVSEYKLVLEHRGYGAKQKVPQTEANKTVCK